MPFDHALQANDMLYQKVKWYGHMLKLPFKCHGRPKMHPLTYKTRLSAMMHHFLQNLRDFRVENFKLPNSVWMVLCGQVLGN